MRPVKQVMVVDNDDIFVFLTKRIILETNLTDEIKIFGNGQAAISYLKKITDNKGLLPEIIFLDLFMPILDGWGFLEEYILLNPRFGNKVTLYIVSSSVSPHDIERAKSFSVVSDFIVKPVVKERFISIVKELQQPLTN